MRSLIRLSPTILGVAAALGCADGPILSPPSADLMVVGPAVQRSVAEFAEAQGSFCIDDGAGGCFLFAPPYPNFFVWSSPTQNRGIRIDYAGSVDALLALETGVPNPLGTQVSGSAVERPLADGRAEVSVTLQTTRAFAVVLEGIFDPAGAPLFGYTLPEVLGGAAAALGDCLLRVVFINGAPGAPLPDLVQLLFFPEEGQVLLSISLQASARGPLRAAFGVPEGVPGRATAVQQGLLMTGFRGAVSDGFPVERVNLQVVGR